MNGPGARPDSLHAVALAALRGEDADGHLREFLDAYYLASPGAPRAAMLAPEPAALDSRKDAYLAAVAEHLALRDGLPVPDWALAPGRFLHAPYFPCGLESLKATLLVESPSAFRRRMIFVGRDPLDRPRRHAQGGAGRPDAGLGSGA